MILSDAGADFIKRHESLRLTAYKPTPDDRWTVGFGHAGPDVYQGMQITAYEADQLFIKDIMPAELTVQQSVKIPLEQCQYDAICALLFNVGCAAWMRSRALSSLNQHDFQDFRDQAFGADHGWVRQAGKVLPGLVNRRAAERDLFFNGVYS